MFIVMDYVLQATFKWQKLDSNTIQGWMTTDDCLENTVIEKIVEIKSSK